MKKAICFIAAVALLCSCSDRVDVIFDTPFSSIVDEGGVASSATVSNVFDGYLTELFLNVNASNKYFTEPIVMEYETIVGDGLKEGVDFEIQSSVKSPITFEIGEYRKRIRILWSKNPNFNPEADNTLTIELTGSSVPEMVLGYPGPNSLHRKYTFTKIQ